MTVETANELNKLAANSAPELGFASGTLISGISAPHAKHAEAFNSQQMDWFNKGIENVTGFAPVAAPAMYSGLAAYTVTGNPVIAGATTIGVALTNMFGGSKKGGGRGQG